MSKYFSKCIRFFVLSLMILSFSSLSYAQPVEVPPEPEMDSAMVEMMNKYQDYAKLTEHHDFLSRTVGTWNYTSKYWAAPDTPPEESSGVSESEAIFGGRFIMSAVTGVSMGQPFEGMYLIGYDNVLKVFNSIWIDSMSTGMAIASGTVNAEKTVLTETGSMTDPISGASKPFRAVTTIVNDSENSYEFFVNDPDGKEYKMMEMLYTRGL